MAPTSGMDFARGLLLKYGWTEGKGLGPQESGIAEALKPKLKFDNTGIGHDAAEQFTYHWWEHAYNNAANNIDICKTEDGVSMKIQDESLDITTKKYSVTAFKKNNSLEYGTFLKTSTLTKEGQVIRLREDKPEELSEAEQPTSALPANLTDEELFKICGGLTAHKGARHGLRLNGKLARVEEQEQKLLVQMMHKYADKQETKPVKRKHKGEDKNSIQVEGLTVCKEDNNQNHAGKKHKKKRMEENIDTQDNGIVEELEESLQHKNKKKKRKSKEVCELIEEADATPQLCDSNSVIQDSSTRNVQDNVKVKRKQKQKEDTVLDSNGVDSQMLGASKVVADKENNVNSPKKKKKKKKKSDVEQASDYIDRHETKSAAIVYPQNGTLEVSNETFVNTDNTKDSNYHSLKKKKKKHDKLEPSYEVRGEQCMGLNVNVTDKCDDHSDKKNKKKKRKDLELTSEETTSSVIPQENGKLDTSIVASNMPGVNGNDVLDPSSRKQKKSKKNKVKLDEVDLYQTATTDKVSLQNDTDLSKVNGISVSDNNDDQSHEKKKKRKKSKVTVGEVDQQETVLANVESPQNKMNLDEVNCEMLGITDNNDIQNCDVQSSKKTKKHKKMKLTSEEIAEQLPESTDVVYQQNSALNSSGINDEILDVSNDNIEGNCGSSHKKKKKHKKQSAECLEEHKVIENKKKKKKNKDQSQNA